MLKKMLQLSFVFVLYFVLSTGSLAWSEPAITLAEGVLLNGHSVVLTGSNFGSTGPTIVVFDDFEDNTAGSAVSTTATVGTWTSSNPIATAYDGGVVALLVDATESNQLRKSYANVQEIFLSYKVINPSGYHFPATTESGEFPPQSAWKLAWIWDEQDYLGYQGDDDICLPTWGNGTSFSLSGNDNAFGGTAENGWIGPVAGRPGTSTNWFSFKGWNRASTYLKAGADPVNDNGVIWFSGLSEEFGHKLFELTDRPVFDGDDNAYDNAISQWNTLALSGWHRSGGLNSEYDSTTRAYYDDIYLAVGANAAARVEIGDNATYADCTKLAISTPTSWSDTSITATVRDGEFSGGDRVYVFVVDKNNKVSTGYGPLKFGSKIIIPPHARIE